MTRLAPSVNLNSAKGSDLATVRTGRAPNGAPQRVVSMLCSTAKRSFAVETETEQRGAIRRSAGARES